MNKFLKHAQLRKIKKYASGISVARPSFYSPLFTPTSLQLPRDRKSVNSWCTTKNTPILMYDGKNKPIYNIQPGEKVISAQGNICEVLVASNHEVNKEMVTIYTYFGNLELTHDHILYAIRRDDYYCPRFDSKTDNRVKCKPGKYKYCKTRLSCKDGSKCKGKVVEVLAGELEERDIVLFPKLRKNDNIISKELAKLFGYYLSEGCFYKHPKKKYVISVSLVFHINEKYLIDDIIDCCKKLGYEYTIRYVDNRCQFVVRNKSFAELCLKYCGQYSWEKKLSDFILGLREDLLSELVGTYISGDGCQSKDGWVTLSTVSKDLVDQLYNIVFPKIGILTSNISDREASIRTGKDGRVRNSRELYTLTIGRTYTKELSKYSLKVKEVVPQTVTLQREAVGAYVLTPIIKIEKRQYKGTVYNIEVENDHSYIANGIAVRNCRHFYETEPYPATCIDLYSTLPINGYTIECENPYIEDFFIRMCKDLDLLNVLRGISLEYWKIGDVFPMGELDDELGIWKRFVLLNPDFVDVKRNPLADHPIIELIPDEELKKIVFEREPIDLYNYFMDYLPDVINAVKKGSNIRLDYTCVSHIRHMPSPYGVYGTPLLKRVFKTLMYREMLRRAQFTIAERYVMPLKIFKLGTQDELPEQGQIDEMQDKLTALVNDPSLVLVTHARLNADWQGISGKALMLNAEFNFMEKELLAGLGINAAFLHGEGPTYQTSNIGGIALFQRLENFRKQLKYWVEEKIFKPICELQGFYDQDPDTGQEVLIVPNFKWEQLRFFDESSRQGQFLNLRNAHMLSIKTLHDSYKIDTDIEAKNLENEKGTIWENAFAGTGATGRGPTAGAGAGGARPGAGRENLSEKQPTAEVGVEKDKLSSPGAVEGIPQINNIAPTASREDMEILEKFNIELEKIINGKINHNG